MTREACNTIPPVVPEGYIPKGTSSTIAGLDFNTYVTGPLTAKVGILAIYDIFGVSSQTTQGADLLAARLSALVLIPDFFRGSGAKPEWFPVDTEEKKAALEGFRATMTGLGETAERIPGVVRGFQGYFPGVESWGAYGLCWGGKVVALSSGAGTPFSATAQVHPGILTKIAPFSRMDKADAETLTIPHAILASKDEPGEVVQAYSEIIAAKALGGVVETYDTMWHGWMGARADLQQEKSWAEYARGYAQLGEFLEKYLV